METKVLAVAAGHEITEDEVNQFINNMPQEQRAYMSNPQARAQLLEQIIHLHLFAAYGKEELNIPATDAYKKVLENVQTEIISNMAVTETIKNSTVTDEEVEAYYEENKDRFVSAPTASAKHILVDTEDKCNEVLAEINAGTKTFEDAAKEYSTCPSKERGGDLGTFGKGQMVPEFDAAVFGAEVGKVLGPVKTQFGYHLIRVKELRQAETQPFESVKDQIRQSLVQAAQKKTYSEKVAELEGKYGVTRN